MEDIAVRIFTDLENRTRFQVNRFSTIKKFPLETLFALRAHFHKVNFFEIQEMLRNRYFLYYKEKERYFRNVLAGGGHGTYAACSATCRPAPSLPFRLGPVATRLSAGQPRFTLRPFRVRVPTVSQFHQRKTRPNSDVFFWRRTRDSKPKNLVIVIN